MRRLAQRSSRLVLAVGDARRRDGLALHRRVRPCRCPVRSRTTRSRSTSCRATAASRSRSSSPSGRRGRAARAARALGARSTGSPQACCSRPASSAWHYAVNGVSILVVRQIPAHEAFHAAAAEQAVALPAVLAGIAGALLARPGPVAAQGVAHGARVARRRASDCSRLLDAVFPEHRMPLVARSTPPTCTGSRRRSSLRSPSRSSSRARSLARGSRRAWQIAVVLLALLFVLHVERRFDDGAIVTGIAVVALLACRGSFRSRGDPSARPRVLAACGARAPPASSSTGSSRSGSTA